MTADVDADAAAAKPDFSALEAEVAEEEASGGEEGSDVAHGEVSGEEEE